MNYSKIFKPTAATKVSSKEVLKIQIVKSQAEYYVLSAFFNSNGEILSRVTKNRLQVGGMSHQYFIRDKQRYYLSEFKGNLNVTRMD